MGSVITHRNGNLSRGEVPVQGCPFLPNGEVMSLGVADVCVWGGGGVRGWEITSTVLLVDVHEDSNHHTMHLLISRTSPPIRIQKLVPRCVLPSVTLNRLVISLFSCGKFLSGRGGRGGRMLILSFLGVCICITAELI